MSELPKLSGISTSETSSLLYSRLENGEYQLAVTNNHWVSDFDALVYRSNQDYPPSWEEGWWKSKRIDGWIYAVGFSQYEESGR